MLDSLEQHTGKEPGSTVLFDRGLAFDWGGLEFLKTWADTMSSGRATDSSQPFR